MLRGGNGHFVTNDPGKKGSNPSSRLQMPKIPVGICDHWSFYWRDVPKVSKK